MICEFQFIYFLPIKLSQPPLLRSQLWVFHGGPSIRSIRLTRKILKLTKVSPSDACYARLPTLRISPKNGLLVGSSYPLFRPGVLFCCVSAM